jgi:NAD-dependent SIR2 family protein deacetylase
MPDYKSEEPAIRAPSANAFNDGTALSHKTQPHYRDLLTVLADPTTKVTFFVGAGVSIDAGFPSWDGLVQGLSLRIADERVRDLAMQDGDNALRKAESIFRLIHPSSTATDAGILQEVLYTGMPKTEPGSLARIIAKIALKLGERCSILTTNFDDVLETAIEAESKSQGNDATPQAYSLRNETQDQGKPVPTTVDDLPAVQEWRTARDSVGAFAVMHLHGMTRRREEPLRPLILTESQFLRYGGLVRQVINEELKDRVVVFVGVSLGDPNVIGPLWDRAQSADERTPCFALQVTGTTKGATSVRESRSYTLAKYEYVESVLDVRPIFLKSYSQLYQALTETWLCLKHGDRYFDKSQPKPMSYGERYRRLITACHERVAGDLKADFAATFDHRVMMSQKLGSLLLPSSPVGKLLSHPDERIRAAHRHLRHQYDDFSVDPDAEKFGLALWLRTISIPSGERAAPYALEMVSSSTNVHFSDWSQRRIALIKDDTHYPAARVVYSGLPRLQNLDRVSNFPVWWAALAFPLTLTESDDGDDDVIVGAVVLNTTFHVHAEDKQHPVSVIAAIAEYSDRLDQELVQPLHDGVAALLRD